MRSELQLRGLLSLTASLCEVFSGYSKLNEDAIGLIGLLMQAFKGALGHVPCLKAFIITRTASTSCKKPTTLG